MKIMTLAGAISAATLLSACSGTAGMRGGCSESHGCEVEAYVEVTWGMRLLNSVQTMLANVYDFEFTQWNSIDFSDFRLDITEHASITNIAGRQVEVLVYDGYNVIGSKHFETTRQGNSFMLKDPESAKVWSEQFIDIGTKIAVRFEEDTYVAAQSTVTYNVVVAGNSVYSFDVERNICGGGSEAIYLCPEGGW